MKICVDNDICLVYQLNILKVFCVFYPIFNQHSGLLA